MLFDFQDPDRLQEAGCAFHMWQGMASPVTQPDDTEHTRLNYLSGGFLLASRELLVRAGLLAEDYFMYCEDVDYSRRLERAGATLRLVSSARAWHKGGASSRYRSATHDYYVVRNGLQVVRRFSPLTLPSAMVYLAVRCGAPKVWRGEWSRLAVMARAYRDFFTGRMGRAGVLPGESGG
jgi:GT2 family glycosyltransferase